MLKYLEFPRIVLKNITNLLKKHNLAIELVSDEDGKVCEMFGVWVEKSMYGKKNTWELKGQLFFLTRISVLLISGKK